MDLLGRFHTLNRRVCGVVEWIGVFAFLLMMVITCIDVAGAKILKAPVYGALDVIVIAQLIAISTAIASTLGSNKHIQVEFFAMMFPKRIQAIMECIVNLLGFSLFVLIVWRLFAYGYDFQIEGEESPTAQIPLYPFVYCAAIANIPVCLVFLYKFLVAIGIGGRK